MPKVSQHRPAELPKRKRIRLKEYDYSSLGYYFVTLCVQKRKSLYGKIIGSKMILNESGVMLNKQWQELPSRFKNIKLHDYIIMPNHFHAIIQIIENDGRSQTNDSSKTVGASLVGARKAVESTIQADAPISPTIGNIIGSFKSITTVEYIKGVKKYNWLPFQKRLWQRNYFEHIIRNDIEYEAISNYIRNNPLKWKADEYYL